VEFKTNSKGLRADHEISYKKPEGVFRLMLLGDSFGMGYGAALEESFIQQAANLISKGLNKKVEVVNLSVSGYSTAEQVIALRQEGIKYSPDLIVSTWHHTDLDENMWSKLFVVENGQLSRKENSYLPGIKQRAMLENIPFYTFLSEHSQAYSFIREKTALMIKSMLRKKLERQIYKNTMPVMIRKNFIVVDPIETFEKTSGNLLYWERSQGHFTPTGNRLVGELLALQVINVIQSENRPK
jgi:lysophospholipase L1-like esterase